MLHIATLFIGVEGVYGVALPIVAGIDIHNSDASFEGSTRIYIGYSVERKWFIGT